jgi:plasmid stabilization system protein ParE
MAFAVFLTNDAALDLEEIHDYIAVHWGTGTLSFNI